MNEIATRLGNEAVLLRRLSRSGDAEAFTEITRLYAGMVYGTCLRVTGDAHHAADAAQETFFQLLKNAGRITGSLGCWLHQVATRRAIDLIRRDAARRHREQEYATTPRETDQWADVSPVVDEALNELDDELRDILVRHFLQGQAMTDIAAARGISQPTVSRRVEQALGQLRERLRTKGVLVAVTSMGALMGGAATSAPAAVMTELGKMAVTTSGAAAAGAATATVTGLKVAATAVAAIVVVGTGGYMVYEATRPAESAPPATAATVPAEPVPAPVEPETAPVPTPSPVTTVTTSQKPNEPARVGGVASPQGFGGVAVTAARVPNGGVAVIQQGMGGMVAMTAAEPPQGRTTTDGALTLFALALVRGDPGRLAECFAGTPEAEAFRRFWENPANDAERELQQVLKSLGPPVEVVQTNATEGGLRIKWKATVRQPFTLTENGTPKTWQRNERFELEVLLRQIGDEWKIVGF